MTAATSRPSDLTSDGCSSGRKRRRRPRGGSRLPTVSIVLGSLSIASFWVVGLGFVLGVTAWCVALSPPPGPAWKTMSRHRCGRCSESSLELRGLPCPRSPSFRCWSTYDAFTSPPPTVLDSWKDPHHP